jgi:hypothetical protein
MAETEKNIDGVEASQMINESNFQILETSNTIQERRRSTYQQMFTKRPESMNSSRVEDDGSVNNFHYDENGAFIADDKAPVVNRYVRHYGFVSLVLFGAGNTIGAGIFAYTGLAA